MRICDASSFRPAGAPVRASLPPPAWARLPPWQPAGRVARAGAEAEAAEVEQPARAAEAGEPPRSSAQAAAGGRRGRRWNRRTERRGDRRVRPRARGRRADDRRRRRQHRRVQLAEAPGEPHPVESIRPLSLSAHHLQHGRHGGRLLEERVGQLEAQVGVDRRGWAADRAASPPPPAPPRRRATFRAISCSLASPLSIATWPPKSSSRTLRQRQSAAQEGISRHLERRLPVTDHHVVAGEGDLAVGLGELAARRKRG